MVDEFDGDDVEVRAIVDSAQTPPFLTEQRVVVARDVGRFSADELAPLVAYLGDPLPTTALVLVGGGGRVPKALTDAVKQAGGTSRSTDPPQRARDRQGWVDRPCRRRPGSGWRRRRRRSSPNASARTSGASTACWPRWRRRSGRRASSRPDDVEPFIGEAGGVPPWELTDAIDAGDTPTALTVLERMSGAGRPPPAAADGDPPRPLRPAGPPRRGRGRARRRRPPTCSGSSRGSRRRRR